ncbi:MAG: RNA-directed DNA polymerase [Alphaproteobacteria bacterium]|nr:RNA-directed DNA polymerase [Alphaproteobacteria bacterium]
MKTYKHLWDKFISMENLELAAKKAVKSKKSKWSTKVFEKNKKQYLIKLQQMLIDGSFNTSPYRIRKIYEPKERLIYILPLYPDHIVHHALINILGPIWQSSFIRDSYACIPGKGLHKASNTIMCFIRRNKYVLQCDIRKFYPSINHKIVFNIIKKKIADKKLLNVLHNIIWSCGGETNLPIGNLTSQWLGNVYLNEMDHFIKEQLHCEDYIRYCDDFCLFSNDKNILHEYKKKIKIFIQDKLKLTFSKSCVYPVSRGIAFIGYRHFKNFIMLRKYGAKKMRKRIFNIAVYNDYSELAVGQLASYRGWAKWCCSYNFIIDICKKVFLISQSSALFIYNKIFKI